MPREYVRAHEDYQCARCDHTIPAGTRCTHYSLRDGRGFVFRVWFHRQCAVAFSNVLLTDATRGNKSLFTGEAQARITLAEIMGD
jgi:hypothetical protein